MTIIKLAVNIAKGIGKRFMANSQKPVHRPISFFKKKILKHLDNFSEKKTSLSGFTVTYKRPYEILHTYEEIFVKGIYNFQTNNRFPLIIDCGSNIGISILYFKSLFPGAKVLAFEPDRENFSLLKTNIEQNNLENISLHQKAVWVNDDGVVFEEKGSEGSRVADKTETQKGILVESLRLATLLQNEDSIDFLKMDIEGAEYEVIKDCEQHLSRINFMFIEYHGTAGETYKLTNMLNIFDKSGFRVYIKNAADLLNQPFLQQKTGEIYDVQLNIFCYKK
jgi:FkbM family methyltransferase